ncbi:siderophore ABC transporter substrate-binding protein [Evansella sp. LMS18]|uniref:siderophore ABC transporter substrate-binding protein n=1 Tax=Evansella sp. LMS18 TaxID=2924033 RepID=UPI0020D0D4D0|nr:siderophore ABC transporter substrate-binding protein [Evansella sp. LMS18]UTR12636.1 siderophore ABC transporter substrate-binding protein [Evansella sp. LMS18]
MKKFILIIAALVLMAALAACGAADSASENNGADGAANAAEENNNEANEANEENEANNNAEVVEEEAGELVIEHELGETTVAKNPESVVVFDFGILDSLDKMGVEVAGVPQANLPSYLEAYGDSAYENTGSLKEPDFEKISELHPDLIIISGRQMELYDEFSKIGPTVFVQIDNSNYMESFSDNMRLLGDIFGQEEFIETELAQLEEQVTALEEKTGDVENALIILANDGNISAYGPGSRFGIIHDEFAITPVDEGIEVSTHGQNVSFEYIADMDPEYLFVIDRGAAVGGESSAQQVIENDLTAGTRAFQNDNVVYLHSDYWYLSGGGLISVSEMVKSIEEAIQ